MIHSFSQKILFLEDRLVNLCTLTLRRFTDSFILNTSRHVFSSYLSTTTTVLVDIMLAITIIKKIQLLLCIICLLPCHWPFGHFERWSWVHESFKNCIIRGESAFVLIPNSNTITVLVLLLLLLVLVVIHVKLHVCRTSGSVTSQNSRRNSRKCLITEPVNCYLYLIIFHEFHSAFPPCSDWPKFYFSQSTWIFFSNLWVFTH